MCVCVGVYAMEASAVLFLCLCPSEPRAWQQVILPAEPFCNRESPHTLCLPREPALLPAPPMAHHCHLASTMCVDFTWTTYIFWG